MVAEDTKYSLIIGPTIKKLEHCIVGKLSNLQCIFTKQPEQSWLHKALNVSQTKEKKKRNIFGPTIKKCEYCIVGR